jgi:hypothetical protein
MLLGGVHGLHVPQKQCGAGMASVEGRGAHTNRRHRQGCPAAGESDPLGRA